MGTSYFINVVEDLKSYASDLYFLNRLSRDHFLFKLIMVYLQQRTHHNYGLTTRFP